MLPNLSITKHDFNLECKQTWSGNKVHTYTRVNEGVGGIREAQTICNDTVPVKHRSLIFSRRKARMPKWFVAAALLASEQKL